MGNLATSVVILAVLFGGRAAEEIVFNSITTGAGNDIERATDMARKMVCEWGMSELGPLSFGKREEQIFLGREIAQHRDYSETTAIRIDEQVKKLREFGILDPKKPVTTRDLLEAGKEQRIIVRAFDDPHDLAKPREGGDEGVVAAKVFGASRRRYHAPGRMWTLLSVLVRSQ